MKSRHLPKFVFGWLGERVKAAKSAAERRQAKDQTIVELLALTPSAIHVKFVGDHIFKYRQDLLDQFVSYRRLTVSLQITLSYCSHQILGAKVLPWSLLRRGC